MGGKDEAPKGPDWQKLLDKLGPLIAKNNDIFTKAMDFTKDRFSKGDEFVKKLEDWGMDASGKLGDMANNFKATSGQAIDKMQGIADKFSGANLAEFNRGSKQANEITGALMPGIKNEAALGNELIDRYRTQGVPYEDQYLAQLRGWDTTGRREGRAGEAVSDIAMASEAAREAEMRKLEGYGINPGQVRSASLDARLQAQNAVAKAAAANQARRQVEGEGLQLGANAVDIANNSARLGSDMGGAAAQRGGAAAAIGATPGATYLQGLANLGGMQRDITSAGFTGNELAYNMQRGATDVGMAALGGAAGQHNTVSNYGTGAYATNSNINANSANMLNTGYSTGGMLNANDIQRTELNNANSFGAQLGSLAGALGPAAMMAFGPAGAAMGAAAGGASGGSMLTGTNMLKNMFMDRGGSVPQSASPSGGAIPDDVPAMLTTNEYVVDADTVRWFGEKTFANMQSKAKEGLTGIPAGGRSKQKKVA